MLQRLQDPRFSETCKNSQRLLNTKHVRSPADMVIRIRQDQHFVCPRLMKPLRLILEKKEEKKKPEEILTTFIPVVIVTICKEG